MVYIYIFYKQFVYNISVLINQLLQPLYVIYRNYIYKAKVDRIIMKN